MSNFSNTKIHWWTCSYYGPFRNKNFE